jgi:hypothetical protein
MPRGGFRLGAGRKAGGGNTTGANYATAKSKALIQFNAVINASDLLRPEEILLRVANGIPNPDGGPWSPDVIDAAKALLPYSLAKPASVSIHHVTRTDRRQYTDEELERIADTGSRGGGTFSSTESPLLLAGVVRNRVGTDGPEAGEAPPAAN